MIGYWKNEKQIDREPYVLQQNIFARIAANLYFRLYPDFPLVRWYPSSTFRYLISHSFMQIAMARSIELHF